MGRRRQQDLQEEGADPLQNQVADNIKREIGGFTKIERFHAEPEGMPFADCVARAPSDLESLFELAPAKYKLIRNTRADCVRLKNVWDMKALVTATFEHWRAMLWEGITPRT